MPVAIDIGTRNLHLVTGRVTGDRITLDKMVIDTIPSGLVQDGVIREFTGLETALKNTLAQHKIKDKNCIITINGTHIYTREADIPKSAPKVMANVVNFEVQNAMNASKDITVEYIVTKQTNPDNPNLVHVRASAIQTEHILDYGKLLNSVKLKPVAMDIHPNAITKLMLNRDINDMPNNNSNIMLIDIGCVTSTAYMLSNGEIAYTRIIPVGAIDVERYVIHHNNSVKPGDHISLDGINLSLENLRADPALGDAVRPLVLSLSDGVNRIQQFMAGRLQGQPLDKIFIYGRGSMFAGFEETLSESMRIKVEKVTKLAKINVADNTSIAPFLNAIGALIRR